MKQSYSVRAEAANICHRVITHNLALDDALEKTTGLTEHSAFLKALCYGTLRFLPKLEWITLQLLQKPLKKRDDIIQYLIYVGLYELIDNHSKPYAIVNETVQALIHLKKTWAKGLVNAVLRQFIRERDRLITDLEKDNVAYYAHPKWWIDTILQDWPMHWRSILSENNAHPPLTLRIQNNRISRHAYLEACQQQAITAHEHPVCQDAIIIDTPQAIETLPGYANGEFVVQDAAAQLAAPWLAPEAGDRVLDACAAPGGKTTHLLSYQSRLRSLVAVDPHVARMTRLQDNLKRLQLSAQVIIADVIDYLAEHKPCFDKILLDAPCSASGIIRRHVDIKYLRKPSDIDLLVKQQEKLLTHVWPRLVRGGKLLYVTCSIFKRENEDQIMAFLAEHKDARCCPLPPGIGHMLHCGCQILPGQTDMDGFYYALLEKV